jgi:DMSO/TMAO reductase YedYZ molybdopterin-dependent catalytic subunit
MSKESRDNKTVSRSDTGSSRKDEEADANVGVRLLSLPQMKRLLTRRALLATVGAVTATSLLATHWSKLSEDSSYQPILDIGDVIGRRLQRLALRRRSLAPEYRLDQISLNHPVNGGFGAKYIDPDPAYDRMVAQQFRDWRLKLRGLLEKPSDFSLADIRAMPARTQITMHSCDAGWSAIGQWTGVPLGWMLQQVGISSRARYVVFHAMDRIAGQHIFDSIDLFDAFHPQTILAHRFNGEPLPVGHGAPLRLRLELQIGYKNVKHLEQIEVVDSLEKIAGGRGGYFQTYGYQWYAGQ